MAIDFTCRVCGVECEPPDRADLEAQLQAVTRERDTARETSREMNRRNQELQHTLNIESGRKAWKGYFDACWRIMKDDYDKYQAIQAHNKTFRGALEQISKLDPNNRIQRAADQAIGIADAALNEAKTNG